MTLYDLEQQLKLARLLGAEDNATVYVDREVHYGDGDIDTEAHEPKRATLERGGRQEIWIR